MTPIPAEEVNRFLLGRDIIGGIDLAQSYPDKPNFQNALLLSFTELTTREDIDDLVDALADLAPQLAAEKRLPVGVGGRQ